MKNLLKLSLLGLTLLTFMVSCEKNSQLEKEEGIKSATGKTKLPVLTEHEKTTSKIVFQQHYNAALTYDEAVEKFIEDAEKKELPDLKGGPRSIIKFLVSTKTGTNINEGTDGQVMCILSYTTDKGKFSIQEWDLNNPGNDREGGWDMYIVQANLDYDINWVELTSASIWLKGTDGWFISDFHACLNRWNQIYPNKATGVSDINCNPYKWLDNRDEYSWNGYYTGEIGSGRMTFIK